MVYMNTAHITSEDGFDFDIQKLHRITDRSILQRINDWLFGYDFFISYRWSDGRQYSLRLAEALQKKGYECFLDTSEFLPGDNWIVDGARAIQKTRRLIFICTPDALVDPKNRKQQDPIIKELTAFNKNNRNKVRINIQDISDQSWSESDVSKFFTSADLYEDDFQDAPSFALIEKLDEKFNLEKTRNKRMRAIGVACGVLAVLSIALTIALSFAVSNYKEALDQQQKANHNLGLANLNEASRLASEAKNWNAANLLGKTNGLIMSDSQPEEALLSRGSNEFRESKKFFFNIINKALRPVDKKFPPISDFKNSIILPIDKSLLKISMSSDGNASKRDLLNSGLEEELALPERALYLNAEVFDGSKIFWIDTNGNAHLYDLEEKVDQNIGFFNKNIDGIKKYWMDSTTKTLAYAQSDDGDEFTLWVKNFEDKTLKKLDGVWNESTLGVFLEKDYLLMVGNSPFRGPNSGTNIWYAVLFNKNETQPISILELKTEIFNGTSGGLPPKMTAVVGLRNSASAAAIGADDGSLRMVSIKQLDEQDDSSPNAVALMNNRTLRWTSNYNASITNITYIDKRDRLAVGTDDGKFFVWKESVGELLNVIQAHESPVERIFDYGSFYLTVDSNGNLMQWKDRLYSHRLSFDSEILAIESTGDNTIDVYTSDSVVHSFTYTVDGFKLDSKKNGAYVSSQDPNIDWISKVKNRFSDEVIAKVAIIKEKKQAVIAFESNHVELWTLDDELFPSHRIWSQEFSGNVKKGVYIAITPDNKKLAIAGYASNDSQRQMKLLSMEDGNEILQYSGDSISEFGNDYPAVFVNSGNNLITGLYGFLYSWPTDLSEVHKSWKDKK